MSQPSPKPKANTPYRAKEPEEISMVERGYLDHLLAAQKKLESRHDE
ncbi:MAG: hypothetical protein LBI99_11140 [Propionibacteriaceae bacterium]|nr:hypothetical protein [Propionibacteriaceae bacterium]